MGRGTMAARRGNARAAALWAGALALSIGAAGCGEASAPRGPSAEVEMESSPIAPVALIWQTPAGGNVLPAGGALEAVLRNHTEEPIAGELSVVSSGLDGRLVERTLGMFSLSGGEEQSVSVPVRELPIQAEVSDSFAALQAAFTHEGVVVRVPSVPLYYHFRAGFSEVVLRTADEVLTDPRGGVLTDNPMAVEGRMLDASGRMGAVADLGSRGQGLSGARFVPSAEETPLPPDGPVKRAAGTVAAALGAATVNLCSTWRVQFIDSGFGEDVWPTTAWQDVPAAFARILVLSDPANVLLWQGNLDVNGCTSLTTLPAGNYRIQQSTTNTRRGNVIINTYYMNGSSEGSVQVFANFSVPSSGTVSRNLHPTSSNDGVQAAAVVGQVLATHSFNGGMGIKDGTYKLRANAGCGGLDPPTDPCFNTAQDIVYVGLTVLRGAPTSHWKFVIAHEMGHMVSYRAMGRYTYNYDDVDTQHAICRCDHYGPESGNRTHCLQSREHIGGAQNEGFGHAFAARTFNYTQHAEGKFVYYKPRLNASGSITNPPFAVSAFDPRRWMNEYCPQAGKGVEWDWMTFYFSVASTSSQNATTFDNLFAIYNRACSGNPNTKCTMSNFVGWAELDAAASTHWGGPGTNKYFRFNALGVSNRINY